MAAIASWLVLALAGAAFAQSVSLQPCRNVSTESFSVTPDGPVVVQNLCLEGVDSDVVVNACDSTNKMQSWHWNSDNTVESVGKPGLCWNANGGSTGVNTTIILYTCGQADALNDYFVYDSSTKHVVGTESMLCLSSAVLPPAPPGVCSSDLDCSLNGNCTNSKCSCYKPWHGSPNCESLVFSDTPSLRGYGMSPNVTSWGGSVAYSSEDKMFHMFVAEMAGHCPLSTWGYNSQVTHAVSATPEGPYIFSEVSLIPEAHNPAIVTQTLPNGTVIWVLFHIGDATSGVKKNCTKFRTRPFDYPEEEGGSTLHVALSPYGPFKPVLPAPPSCNNPAPWLHANGTYFLLCDGFTLYRAPGYTGPWTKVTDISAGGGVPGNYEDPYLFIDPRGNWHVIYHVYRTDGTDSTDCEPGHAGAVVAGHYFSSDGYKWHAASVSPYGNTVNIEGGGVQLLSTRERPKMLFDPVSGAPTHLFNGVCAGTSTCPPTPCVNCKYDYWDFTNASPLSWY